MCCDTSVKRYQHWYESIPYFSAYFLCSRRKLISVHEDEHKALFDWVEPIRSVSGLMLMKVSRRKCDCAALLPR